MWNLGWDRKEFEEGIPGTQYFIIERSGARHFISLSPSPSPQGRGEKTGSSFDPSASSGLRMRAANPIPGTRCLIVDIVSRS
jgi:hypothetical protein